MEIKGIRLAPPEAELSLVKSSWRATVSSREGDCGCGWPGGLEVLWDVER